MGMLDGKVAVITGGSRGLGMAIAKAYAREGAAVVLGSRTQAAVDEAVAELAASGARAAGLACDVGDLAQVEALAACAVKEFGGFDVWVNNAALSAPYGPTGLIPPDRYEAVIRTNITGTYHGSRVALRHFQERGRGKLINLLGKGADGPTPLQNAYAPSKAWVASFTRGLVKEYAGTGIGIHLLQPGLMLTDMVTRPEALDGYVEKVGALGMILRLLGNPPEVPAEKALWLASGATDGKMGVEVRVLSRGGAMGRFLKAGLRRLTGGRIDPVPLDVKVVKPQ
ncbi:MAG TPA: SDR family oxidoreductase [Symbiobacteriaceae bacterium]|nr:SDR family oxidoreductase [Symbiobacteriaceae bacterium]